MSDLGDAMGEYIARQITVLVVCAFVMGAGFFYGCSVVMEHLRVDVEWEG